MARTLTREQFSTGTNIDGNRIDKALGDIQDRINNVPLMDIKTAYIPYQMVGGFTPTKSKFLRRKIDGNVSSPSDPFPGMHPTGMDCWIPATHTFTNTSGAPEMTTVPVLSDEAKKENPISVKGALRDTCYNGGDADIRYYQMSKIGRAHV